MIYLIRFNGNLHGTQGMLFAPSWNCCTMEPPWLHNVKSRSCIPEGRYNVTIVDSPKYGRVYEVQDVPGRTGILFHAGNYAGDEETGYRTDTDGCILLGEEHGILDDQEVVLNSRITVDEFMDVMDGRPFTLAIKGVPYTHE